MQRLRVHELGERALGELLRTGKEDTFSVLINMESLLTRILGKAIEARSRTRVE